MLREPVRGGFPEPSFHALPGIDRARAYLRGLVPRPPLSHLVGYRVTQVGPGSATLTMPASPWLQGLDDGMFIEFLVAAALTGAAMTSAPPGAEVRLTSVSVNRFRPATTASGTLVARGRTLNSGRTFPFTEVLVEDSLGRAVIHATGAAIFRPVTSLPAPSPAFAAVPLETPSYSTPDPHERPLPGGVGLAPVQLWEEHDGPAIIRMYLAGELPQMPVTALLGLRILAWEEGRVEGSLPATEWLAGEGRDVAPGVLTFLAHVGLGGTTALRVPRRRVQVGILDDSVSFYRSVACDGRDLRVRGRITHRPGDFVVSSMDVTDADGNLVAVGHRTSVFLEPRATPAAKSERRLLTVLFTDLVESTRTVEQSGDGRWSELLAEHHRLVRSELEVHHGREVKTTGDGFLATFDSPTRAMQCARAIRDGVRRLGLEMRAGIHTGECEVGGGDVAGLAVHVAARVQSAAQPGEILVSATVRDLTAGSGIQLVDRGGHELKGLDGQWALFAVEG